MDGLPHPTVSVAVKLPLARSGERISAASFSAYVKHAWARLRAHLPAVACRTFLELLPPETESNEVRRYAFRYDVPQNQADVDVWIDETVFFDSNEEGLSLQALHRKLKDERWWLPSSDHYVAELHVTKLSGDEEWSLQCALNTTFTRSELTFLVTRKACRSRIAVQMDAMLLLLSTYFSHFCLLSSLKAWKVALVPSAGVKRWSACRLLLGSFLLSWKPVSHLPLSLTNLLQPPLRRTLKQCSNGKWYELSSCFALSSPHTFHGPLGSMVVSCSATQGYRHARSEPYHNSL